MKRRQIVSLYKVKDPLLQQGVLQRLITKTKLIIAYIFRK